MFYYRNTNTDEYKGFSERQARLEVRPQWIEVPEYQVPPAVIAETQEREEQALREKRAIYAAAQSRSDDAEIRAKTALEIAAKSAPPPLTVPPQSAVGDPGVHVGVLSQSQGNAKATEAELNAKIERDSARLHADGPVGILTAQKLPPGPPIHEVRAKTAADSVRITEQGQVGILGDAALTASDVVAAHTADPADDSGDVLGPVDGPQAAQKAARPSKADPKADWVKYGTDAFPELTVGEADALTKPDLIRRVEQLESAKPAE